MYSTHVMKKKQYIPSVHMTMVKKGSVIASGLEWMLSMIWHTMPGSTGWMRNGAAWCSGLQNHMGLAFLLWKRRWSVAIVEFHSVTIFASSAVTTECKVCIENNAQK